MSGQNAPHFGKNTWQELLLDARDLACERGGRLILKDLNFSVASGEAIELRGPNGAGKSSLLRLLAGLNRPAAGSLNFSGDSLAESSHYIGHQEALKPALTVRENLDFWSRFLGGHASPNLTAFRLENLGNDETRFLSEGQRRRLALSRLVSVPRPVWLLDEPTIGLDQTALSDLRREMENHLTKGGLIIAATHTSLGLASARILEIVRAA